MTFQIINPLALAPVRTVAPTLHLVELDDIKNHLRVDANDDDTLITALRDVVTAHLDGWTGVLGRALLTQTWRQDFGVFPSDYRIRLPLSPITSITGITYYDLANAQQTLATSVYTGPFTDGLGPYVALTWGQVWPTTYLREDAVSITFATGYTSALLPTPIRQAALLMIGELYENREGVMTDLRAASVKIEMSATVDALLAPYRRIGL